MSAWKANRLRVLRAEKRLTQRTVAEKLGISQASYWQFEVAYKEPSTAVQKKIARILGVTLDELLARSA